MLIVAREAGWVGLKESDSNVRPFWPCTFSINRYARTFVPGAGWIPAATWTTCDWSGLSIPLGGYIIASRRDAGGCFQAETSAYAYPEATTSTIKTDLTERRPNFFLMHTLPVDEPRAHAGQSACQASIVSVRSGTSGDAPVQAFQRLHRGYSIHLFFCLESSPRGFGVSDGASARRSLPHRGPMVNSPLSKPNSAPSNGPSRSQQIRHCAVSVNRAPLTDRSRRAGFRHGRRTDIFLSRCQ